MLQIWLKTLFSFRSYHSLRTLGFWRIVLFSVYLILIGILVFNLYFTWQLHHQLPNFIQKLPTLTFNQGRLLAPTQTITLSVPETPYVVVLDIQAERPSSVQELLDKKILLFVTADSFYLPTASGINSIPIPQNFDGEITPQKLEQYLPNMYSLLQSVAFIASFLIFGFFFIFSILLAAGIIVFWRMIKKPDLSLPVVWKWAVLLQGPALVLWSIHLLFTVPLFTFALFILFNIYIQQIFNTLPIQGDKNHAA